MYDFLMDNFIEQKKCKRLKLDKRKYIGISTPCIARFRVKQYEGQEMYSSEWNIVAAKDMSAGGIMFDYYKMELGFGTVLELQIDFIKSKPTINCVGRVVRIVDAHVNAMHHIATEFLEINDLDREIINTTVETILKREVRKEKIAYSEIQTKIKNVLKLSIETILKGEVKKEKITYSKNRKRDYSGLQTKLKNTLANIAPLRIILHGW
ncbi:MAG: PilZ domain-containing protein [Candidatus Brocadiaceae bacterium]|nr:PilZ domain-containing protein [Candidatus Brocadiaceae bacterium]